jgi:hypothetical protein
MYAEIQWPNSFWALEQHEYLVIIDHHQTGHEFGVH